VDDKVSGSSARGRADHQSWQDVRALRQERATEGALEVRTATAVARGRAPEALPTERPKAEWTTDAKRVGRPGGIRFGSLVHGVLEVIPYEEGVLIEPFVAQQAALLGAKEPEEIAAVSAVRAAISHPLLRRAAVSADCRREAPFVHRSGEVECLEGTIDLVFREDRGGAAHWVVVEFKTALGDDETARRYGIQLQIYVDAVRAATGASVEGTLLIV
jgi:ATP-dependent exoDNAse (exonuclease V) beta subunit